MTHNLQAIYENGVLRLLEPVSLPERARVTVAILENGEVDPWLDPEFAVAVEGDEAISLEEVRMALTKIPGSLTGDFVAERDER